ncbi:MAG: sterol desaturase family protein [Acidimicrobiales bacterium]
MSAAEVQLKPTLSFGGLRAVCPSSLVVAAVTGLLVWAAVSNLVRHGNLASEISAGRAELAAPLLVGLVVLTGVCERRWPAEARPLFARGHIQDACYLVLHAVAVIPLMTLLGVGATVVIAGHLPWIELRSAEHLPRLLLVAITIVAMDGANWLAHYADHRVRALWRFHALHHSQEELSVLTSFRAHPLMHTTGFILSTIPVAVLMPTLPIAPVLITSYVCIGTLQHANLRWTFGSLGRVIVSPAYHRLHHDPSRQDVNLGVVLVVWDVIAGCARFPSLAGAASATGLNGRPVPVEQHVTARSGLGLMVSQLGEPFRGGGGAERQSTGGTISQEAPHRRPRAQPGPDWRTDCVPTPR